MIRRDKATHSLYVYSSFFNQALSCLCFPPLLPFYSPDYLGRQLLNQPLIVYMFFSSRPSLPVSQIASTTLCLSSPLPDPVYRLPSLGSGSLHVCMCLLVLNCA